MEGTRVDERAMGRIEDGRRGGSRCVGSPASAKPGAARSASFLALALALICSLSNCVSVRLVADYDENTDQSVTEVQKKVEDFFSRQLHEAGSANVKYEACQSFYTEIEASLRLLSTRVAAVPKNAQTAQQVVELIGTVNDLEKIHKKHPDGLPPESIIPAREGIESVCKSILTLELAKKRGD